MSLEKKGAVSCIGMAHIEETLRISYPKRCYGRNVGTCASWKMGKAKRNGLYFRLASSFQLPGTDGHQLSVSEIGIPSYLLPKAETCSTDII